MIRHQYAAKYLLMNGGQAFLDKGSKEFTIPKEAKLISATFSISSFPNLHVEFMLVDGDYDYNQVVDDRTTRENILAVSNTGDSGRAGDFAPLFGYIVKDTLRLAVWAHNMRWGKADFHGTLIVAYDDGN